MRRGLRRRILRQFGDRDILPMEGCSLAPAFDNKPLARDAIYWEHGGNAAILAGDWELVRMGHNGPWELYDLKSDRTELRDLAAVSSEPAGKNAQAKKDEAVT